MNAIKVERMYSTTNAAIKKVAHFEENPTPELHLGMTSRADRRAAAKSAKEMFCGSAPIINYNQRSSSASANILEAIRL